MKETISEDYCQTDKTPSVYLPCILSKLAKGTLSGPNHVSFFFLGVNSATLSKSSFFRTECLTLRFGEEL